MVQSTQALLFNKGFAKKYLIHGLEKRKDYYNV